MSDEKPLASYVRGAGKLIVTEHSTRHMKSYLVFDWELKSISMLNGWATLFFSLGSFCASIAIGLWTNFFITDTPSEAATKYGLALEWVFGIAAAVLFVLAFGAVFCRRSEVSRIKREAGEESISFWRGCFVWAVAVAKTKFK